MGGVQRIYRFKGGYGLSVVNSTILHSYPFAWEAAVIKGVTDAGNFEGLDYTTGLTEDVEVFASDKETNDFVTRVAKHFENFTPAEKLELETSK